MITKTFEVRDRGTFIPLLAVKLRPACEEDRYLLARSGYGTTEEIQSEYVVMWRLSGGKASCQPSELAGDTRTLVVAGNHIILNFDQLQSGAVIDVEYLLGMTDAPKKSEALQSW